jgi:hypothetical protein
METWLQEKDIAEWAIGCISTSVIFLTIRSEQLDTVLPDQGVQHLLGHKIFNFDTSVFRMDQLHEISSPIAMVWKLSKADSPTSSCQRTQTEEKIEGLFVKELRGISWVGIDTVWRVRMAGSNKHSTSEGQTPSSSVNYAAVCECNSPCIN